MAPAAAMSLMFPPEVASLGDLSAYSLVAQVVIGPSDPLRFYLPVVLKSADAEAMEIDFGDGEKWVVDGDIEAEVVNPGSTSHYLTGVAYHDYPAPGTYCLTMKGARAFSAGIPDRSYSMVTSKNVPQLRNVYRCTLGLKYRSNMRSSAQFAGFSGLDLVVMQDAVYGDSHDSPRRLYLMRSFSGGLLLDGFDEWWGNYLSSRTQEIYAPTATCVYGLRGGGGFLPDNVFVNCASLRLFCAPSLVDFNTRYTFSHVPSRIDVYVGRLHSIHGKAFARYGGAGAGANVYLHVDLAAAQFRALSGWESGPDAHPWGANYLRVYATDLIFDCRGMSFLSDDDDTGHLYDPDTGLWVDDDGRWIDHDGNYVMPDGVTPAVWLDGAYYKADSQGRRIDDDGHFLDRYGNVVSDCGRPMTSDGLFVSYTVVDDVIVPGDAVDFYGSTLYGRHDLPASWAADHLEYSDYLARVDRSAGEGYWCYRIPGSVDGDPVEDWHFYDSTRHLVFTHRVYLSRPDGQLAYARIDPGTYVLLGFSFSEGMEVRLRGRPGMAFARYPGQVAESEGQLALNFQQPSASEIPADFGLVTADVGPYPTARRPVYLDELDEYPSRADFPASGLENVLYEAQDTGKRYRWVDSQYEEVVGADAERRIATSPVYESVLEYSSVADFPSPGWGNALFEAQDTGKRYRWVDSQYEEAEPGDTEPRVIRQEPQYAVEPSVARVARLAFGWLEDMDYPPESYDHYRQYAVAQVSDSVVMFPYYLGIDQNGSMDDFDLRFGLFDGKAYIASSSGTPVEGDSSVARPEGGWAALRIGGGDSMPESRLNFFVGEVVVSERDASDQLAVRARFCPWMKDGVVKFKDTVSGNFVTPSSPVTYWEYPEP